MNSFLAFDKAHRHAEDDQRVGNVDDAVAADVSRVQVERVLAERAGGYVVNSKVVWCETVARCIIIDLARCEGRKK